MERKWWTLILISLATFMLLLDITVVNVALPVIQRQLHASLSSLQWVVDAYSLTLAAFLLTAGSLGDRLGRRRVFSIGFGIFTFASFLCGISGDPTLLNLARGLQGVGGAAMFATSLALIAQEFHGRDRATAFGVWGATIGGAVAIGPLVGGADHRAPRLGVDLLRQRPDRAGGDRPHRAQARQRRRPGRRPDRLARPAHLLDLALPADLRPDPRQPRGLGQRDDPRLADRLRGADGVLPRDRAAQRPPDARPRPLPQARLQRRQRRRLRPLGRDVRALPLPDHLPAGRARLLAAAGRAALPAAQPDLLRRRPDRRQPLPAGSRPGPARRRDWARSGSG